MELLIAPASAFDFAEALDDAGRHPVLLTRQAFALYALQANLGGSVAVREAATGALALIGGLYPAGAWVEAWWAVGPALKRNLRPALKILKQLMEEVGGDAAPLDVRAHVAAASVAGHRVAAMFGFRRWGQVDLRPWGRTIIWRREFPCPLPSSSLSSSAPRP